LKLALPRINIESSEVLGPSSLLNLFVYYIGGQVLCGKCLKCLTIQYWPAALEWMVDSLLLKKSFIQMGHGHVKLVYARWRYANLDIGALVAYNSVGASHERFTTQKWETAMGVVNRYP